MPLTADERQAVQAEAKRLWSEAHRLGQEGKLSESIAAAEKMLAVDRQLLGNVHGDIAFDLGWLAERYEWLEKFVAAKNHRAEALAIQTARLGKEHWEVINARWAIQTTDLLAALSANQRRQLDSARGQDREVLRLYGAGKFNEAMLAAREAAEIRKAILGENHPNYATSLNELTVLYHSQGNYTRAEPLYRQALDIRKQALGENHPAYAQSLNNLAGLYESQGNYARAELLYRQALDIRKQALGENLPKYATSLNDLAVLYYSQGDYTRAEPL